MTVELTARRFLISGKVQGVFYRASTARVAEQLGVRGHAHNLPDGRVEVLAVGDGAALQALALWLAEGPPKAQVTGVVVHDQLAADFAALQDFRTG